MKAATFFSVMVLVLGLASSPEPGQAQIQSTPMLTAEANRMDQLAAKQGETKVIDKLSADFSSILGADAKAFVIGLRNGTEINVTTPGSVPGTFQSTIIDPPTGKMGFGNVFITLALAQNQLSGTTPTLDQLKMVLVGNEGILTLRSQKMGWGQIGQKLGVKLGSVVSSLRSANQALATGVVSPSGSGQADQSSRGGIVTGQGRAVGKSAQGVSGSEGIVTGSGRPVGPPSGITTGRGEHGLTGGGPGSGGSAKGRSK